MENSLSIMRASILEADAVAEFLNGVDYIIETHSLGIAKPDGSSDPVEPVDVEYKWTGSGPRLIVTGKYSSVNCICSPKVAGPVISNLLERFGDEGVALRTELEISGMYL